jgi:hypothetical protein
LPFDNQLRRDASAPDCDSLSRDRLNNEEQVTAAQFIISPWVRNCENAAFGQHSSAICQQQQLLPRGNRLPLAHRAVAVRGLEQGK